MQKTITALAIYINPFKRRYICPCGTKSIGRAAALEHLSTHPSDTLGQLGTDGRVTF